MTINLYNNGDSKKKLNKGIVLVKSMTGTLREKCDMINPSVLIENAGVISANYAYIPDFKRYYYITKITSERQGLWRVDMHVDVRMSFREQILANTAIVERASNYYNMYIQDPMLPIEQDNFNITYQLGESFDKANVLLLASNSEGTSEQPT